MDLTTILAFVADFQGHKWLPLAVLLIGYLTTLMSDTSKFPINIPDRWKPVLVVGLGQVYAVLTAASGGDTWSHAVWSGAVAAFGTMGLFDLLVRAIFNGNLPKWLAWLAVIDSNLASAKKAGVTLTSNVFGRTKLVAPVPKA